MNNNSFKLNMKNIGENVYLKGWINKSRRLGDLIFLDIRNGEDIIQIVVLSNSPSYKVASELRNEFVVSIKGKVIERKNKNNNLYSGDIEIQLSELKIINKSKQLPMLIKDKTDALEKKRLEYRYLDLRRPVNQIFLRKRSMLNKIIRDHFYDEGFIEVETPIITKPTPGGAGEFKVLSNNHKGKYYALVQSPQIYKQLLIYGGVSKYYQIAKCFRDEKSRSDRQLEFTQLDMEMSFATQNNIIDNINKLLKKIVLEINDIDININNIIQMKYVDAINKYGSDKPDIRFKNTIYDISDILKNTPIEFIKNEISIGKRIKAVFFEGEMSNNEIKKIEKLIMSQGASSLFWCKIINNVAFGSMKLLSKKNILDIKMMMGIRKNGILFSIIDSNKKALDYIGRIRLLVSNKLNNIDPNQLSFLWITDFPLFEKNDEGEIESMHNPFTSINIKDKDMFMNIDKNNDKILSISSNSYDLVLNGSEIGGGAIRISNSEEQRKIFELIGISDKEIEDSFGWFLNAQKYGIPEHAGIALGLDRILSILLKKDSIRDVIAFPKTSNGTDEMMKGPIKLK